MDWYEIEYLYPQSYKKFVESMFPNIGVISVSILKYYDLKKLFQFFDNQEIYLNIEMINMYLWSYNINCGNKTIFNSNDSFKKTRGEIEEVGFYECFRLLEKKINYKNNHVSNEL